MPSADDTNLGTILRLEPNITAGIDVSQPTEQALSSTEVGSVVGELPKMRSVCIASRLMSDKNVYVVNTNSILLDVFNPGESKLIVNYFPIII